jgi:CRISPR-associated endonuclease/helicase Cas3
MPPIFDAFFQAATGHPPYDYQRRLACGEQSQISDSPTGMSEGASCTSRLINIPTGLGKTAAVVMAWLWNRIAHPDAAHRATWPRRLVYCLPMRTLVEQTRDNVATWLANLRAKADELGLEETAKADLAWLAEHSPVVLMGGEELDPARRDWDLYPENDAILIGTQDMLLSRALNRGYGMSRYRWPMHFGLLNNDCLWVLDEVQLMGPGVSTACQLEAFRNSPDQGFSTFGKAGSATWYMSATSDPESLQTRDWRNRTRPENFIFSLTEEERNTTTSEVSTRRNASKSLKLCTDFHFGDSPSIQALLSQVLEQHQEMIHAIADAPALPARTLIICNTVDRAVAVHAELAKNNPTDRDLVLLHSRFRPPERHDQMQRLKNPDRSKFSQGQIVVATQVIEAGVDLSSGLLVSEIAPLASLVQRLGRLNRAGEFKKSSWTPLAMIVGLALEPKPEKDKKEKKEDEEKRLARNAKRCLPYDLAACENAATELERVQGDASPANLETIRDAIAASIPRCPYSLQRHELLDFFDTDANLSLGFTDVSPFVRGLDEDTDVQVLWRESWPQEDGTEGTGKPTLFPDFQRDELCSVPISKASDARDVLNQGWIWRGKESGWISVRDAGISPGMTILLPGSAGGYDNAQGWTGSKSGNPITTHYSPECEPPDEDLLSSLENGWQNIEQHTNDVATALGAILDSLKDVGLSNDEETTLKDRAVPWHDVGKNHPGWQQAVADALTAAGIHDKDTYRPFAKFSLCESPQLRNADGSLKFTGCDLRREIQRLRRLFRPGLAHEVASALAFRQAEQQRLDLARDTDLSSLLAEYVIMSHHGHVRKVLRDELPRFPNDARDTETVRGIAHGAPLPAVIINGQPLGCDALSTDCRKMGRGADGHESYTRAVLRLLDHYGPFRLAFFEALFRAADARASKQAGSATSPSRP